MSDNELSVLCDESDNSNASDYEVAWSSPNQTDYSVLCTFAHILEDTSMSFDIIEKTLVQLQLTLVDYPAEYMLQKPHIIVKILLLWNRASQLHYNVSDILETLFIYIGSLQRRIETRRQWYTNDKSLKKKSARKYEGPRQLRLELVLPLILKKTLMQLDADVDNSGTHETEFKLFQILFKVQSVLEQQLLISSAEVLQQIEWFSKQLRQRVQKNMHEVGLNNDVFMLPRLQYILAIFLFQKFIMNHESNGDNLPMSAHIDLLDILLVDLPLREFFPEQMKIFKDFLCRRCREMPFKKVFKYLYIYEENYTTIIDLLKPDSDTKPVDIIKKCVNKVNYVSKLKSTKLIDILMDAIIMSLPKMLTNAALKRDASELLLDMMRIPNENIKLCIYRTSSQSMKRFFTSFINSERFIANTTNDQLLKELLTGIPVTTEILLQIVNDFSECENPKIKEFCMDMLVVPLRAHHLFEEFWKFYLNILLPILPLLHGCTATADELLTKQLLKLSDPDAGYLPIYAVLQNNCCFLFHQNAHVRSEALTRIIYMLTSMDENAVYQSTILELSNVITCDIFVELEALEMNEIFSSFESTFNCHENRAAIDKLLEIIQNTNFDGLVHRSALQQINMLLRQYTMLSYFCERNGTFCVLKVLENCLMHASLDTTDSMCAVSIVAKMLFYDELLRQELAQTNNIYFLLLRTLCLYHFDDGIRQNIATCLYLLIFRKFVHITPPTLTEFLHIKLPKVLLSLWSPFKFEAVKIFQDFVTSENEVPIFKNIHEERQFLRYLIAAKCRGNITEISADYVSEQKTDRCAIQDIDRTLHLNKSDMGLILATNPTHNMQLLLKSAQNATVHETVLRISHVLKFQLLLLNFTSQCTSILPKPLKQQLVEFLEKFLKILPKTAMDMLLYERLIELSYQCLELQEHEISRAIVFMLFNDFKHTIFVMLKEHQHTNRLFRKMCSFLTHVLKASRVLKLEINEEENQMKIYFFDTLTDMLKEHFAQRDFQRVRCLLFVLRELIDSKLHLSDEILYEKCRSFFQFCFCLKSASFTGAQLQRDCLYIICQLRQQMQMPHNNFKPKSSIVRNLVDLCKHQCAEVRALVWCLLMNFIHYRGPQESQVVMKELKFLPENFPGICLNSLLDPGERAVVREFSGNVFIELIATNCLDFEASISLLEDYQLFARAVDILDKECQISCHNVFENNLILTSFHCEIFSCVSRICQLLIRMRADYVENLCKEIFMHKFYNVLKIKFLEQTNHSGYHKMCADLCQLYALCTSRDMDFGRHTLCHDRVFLNHYVQVFSLENGSLENGDVMKIMQLLLVLGRDEVAYQLLCLEFKKQPKDLLHYISIALSVSQIKTHFQNITLAVLSTLLVNSQLHLRQTTFVDILEESVTIDGQDNEPTLDCPSVSICKDLFHLFTKLYPEHFEKFENSPTKSQVKIAECLGLLLRFCDSAAQCADSLKVLDYVLHTLQVFLTEHNCCNKSVARRNEEKRRSIIIQYLQILVALLLNWFSACSAVLSDEMYANRLTRILIDSWPFMAYSEDLKLLVLQLCAVLSERSLVVARKFSFTYPTNKDCLIQLVAKIAKSETDRIKAQSENHLPIIIISLRILINSCSNIEGRLCVSKLFLLDVIDNLYPFNMKAAKIKQEILENWLIFWELFSRYPEGSKPVYLTSVCRVISILKPNNEIRLLLLKIIRNMCFQTSNRASLMSSDDFIHTAYDVISLPLESADMLEEKIVIITSIWKLISGGVKFVSLIRGTKLAKKICDFCEQFYNMASSKSDEKEEDFRNIIFIIYDILSDSVTG